MQFLKSVNSHRKIDTVLALMEKYFYRLQSAKGVAKGLKGRSFELGLLTDIVAKYLLLKFGLTGANIIYRSGGKFFCAGAGASTKCNRLSPRRARKGML